MKILHRMKRWNQRRMARANRRFWAGMTYEKALRDSGSCLDSMELAGKDLDRLKAGMAERDRRAEIRARARGSATADPFNRR